MIRLQSRIFWLLMLIGHGVIPAAWWWVMPHGFPSSHPRFWVNQVLPPTMIVVIGITLAAAVSGRIHIVRATLLSLAAMWLAAAVSGWLIFPRSLGVRSLALVLVSAFIALASFAPALRAGNWPRVGTPLGLLAGAAMGAWFPLTQRGEPPSTIPSGPALDLMLDAPPQHIPRPLLRELTIAPGTGLVTLQRGAYVMHLQPLLSFRSRSPDRFWTVFAPPETRMDPGRRLTGFARRGNGALMTYTGIGRWDLVVEGGTESGSARIDTSCTLNEPVYSHLNSACEWVVAGHKERIFVTFSPCPDAPIEVTHFDYPVGDPARFAYLDVGGRFHVVEAASGEKGPFRTLAEGRLQRGEPVTVTLHEGGTAVARVTLEDWSRQVSTALSPTAGWRVPVNAIEFARDLPSPASPVTFFVTLAGTSVGRGFDSVGHAAGTYRQRLAIELPP